MSDADTSRHVVFIHGMWGRGGQWDGWADRFAAAGWEPHAPTLRYHEVDPAGSPPAGLGRVSLQGYADDLEALIRGLPAPPLLVGHSMGGLLAQILAARGLGRAAVLLCPAPPAGWPAVVELMHPSVLRTMIGHSLKALFVRRPFRLSWRQARYSSFNNMAKAAARAEHDRWVWESGRVLFEIAWWYLDLKGGARVDRKKVTVPTLTVSAGRDRIVPPAAVRAQARRYRDRRGEARHYPDHAHFLIVENGWERLAGDCLAWAQSTLFRPQESQDAN